MRKTQSKLSKGEAPKCLVHPYFSTTRTLCQSTGLMPTAPCLLHTHCCMLVDICMCVQDNFQECGSWWMNSGHQAWWQMSLLTTISLAPKTFFFKIAFHVAQIATRPRMILNVISWVVELQICTTTPSLLTGGKNSGFSRPKHTFLNWAIMLAQRLYVLFLCHVKVTYEQTISCTTIRVCAQTGKNGLSWVNQGTHANTKWFN